MDSPPTLHNEKFWMDTWYFSICLQVSVYRMKLYLQASLICTASVIKVTLTTF